MMVCVCHCVSDRDIAYAVRAGCRSFDDIQDALRVASACGACHDCALDTFESHCTQITDPPCRWARAHTVSAP